MASRCVFSPYDPDAGLQGEAAPVLQVMRRYIRTFFGCKECGRHFEQAAAASMDSVKSPEEAVLWLWNQHNRVNSRLAGKVLHHPWGRGLLLMLTLAAS